MTPTIFTPHLTELELDALTELVNLGVSHSAANLGRIVGRQILLTVPSVRLVSPEEAIELLSGTSRRLVGVRQAFEGEISGRAMLIFPKMSSLELVRAVMGRELALEDIYELENEALAETGNVVLNGCLATMANTLQRNLRISLPSVLRGEPAEFFELPGPPRLGDVVLFLSIKFTVHERDIQGNLAIVMDLPSLEALRVLLAEYIGRTI
jgi:chemotaxis protein CheC